MDDVETKIRKPRRTFPLALALLAIVGGLVGVIASVIIAESYRRGLAVATDMGSKLFENLRTDIAVQQQQLMQPIESAIGILSEDPALGAGHAEDLRGAFLAVLEQNPQITELRVVYGSGNLYAVALLDSAGGKFRTSISAPPDAVYAERIIHRGADGAWSLTWTFLGSDRGVVGATTTNIEAPKYKDQPWYYMAVDAPGTIVQTPAAAISFQRAVGTSFARSFSGAAPGVIASDVSLERLTAVLKYTKFVDDDQIFLFDGDKKLLVSPDVDVTYTKDGQIMRSGVEMLPHPVVRAMLKRFEESGIYASETVAAGGTEFLASVIRLGDDIPGRPSVYLGFATPAATFTGAFIEISRETAAVSILILLAAIPLIIWVAQRFARPLKALEKITDNVARLEMARMTGANTRIREIDHLGNSIANMSNALGQIAKFVPKTLVQNLINTRTALAVGGERRELSFMFTDVRDFTPLAEAMPAEDLMAHMSAYFDDLVGEILALRGTVDKFVGDAIFAFWNAPTVQADHTALACHAALACRTASNRLNARWRAEGRPEWYTRIGVHMGEAVVGNVGSRDRLDYTAVGNAVNMAARLEGLNKYYGTQILASAAIAERVDDIFLLRAVDRVIVKGASAPMTVYELICTRGDASPDLHERCRVWAESFKLYQACDWDAARKAFTALAEEDANDPGAASMRDRIAGIQNTAPSDWDGITRLDSK